MPTGDCSVLGATGYLGACQFQPVATVTVQVLDKS